MLVSVTLLRRAGVRWRRHEVEHAAVGDLRISDAGATSFKRPVLVTNLWEPRASLYRSIGRPLFDPALVHVGSDVFTCRHRTADA